MSNEGTHLMDLTVRDYVADLASKKPAPGGGSAAALAGALGAALGEMVANFTIGKKKYADVEDEMQALLERLTRQREMLLELADHDAHAYGRVADAYALPKDTDEEKQVRQEAIQEALRAAAEVPREICCTEVLGELPALLEKGNLNLISDIGVCAKLTLAAAECGWLNVEINLCTIKDAEFVDALRAEMKECLAYAKKIADAVWEETVHRLCG